ncbi:hypothetical protein ACHAWF_007717, partial [Thalassiosira exigua]
MFEYAQAPIGFVQIRTCSLLPAPGTSRHSAPTTTTADGVLVLVLPPGPAMTQPQPQLQPASSEDGRPPPPPPPPTTMTTTTPPRRGRRKPIHYDFVSIDESCPPVVPSDATSERWEEAEGEPECLSLLRRFYDDLMIPAFPLEDERDDLGDWLDCFASQRRFKGRDEERARRREEERAAKATDDRCDDCDDDDDGGEFDGPAMDVVLMVQVTDDDEEEDTIDRVDAGDEEKGKGRYFFQRRKSSLLLRRRSSLFEGLYAPPLDDATADGDGTAERRCVIIGGAAVEYYKRARTGLLSYVVLDEAYRGCGLARKLHDEALSRLEDLALQYGTTPPEEGGGTTEPTATTTGGNRSGGERGDPGIERRRSPLRAVFAETNAPSAGDVAPEVSLLRHKSLYSLGYRRLDFPYAQPPLSAEDVDASFDDILLLVYFPYEDATSAAAAASDDESTERYCRWHLDRLRHEDDDEGLGSNGTRDVVRMDVGVPMAYVEDFYMSVFGYDSHVGDAADAGESEKDGEGHGEGILDFRTAEYYRLAHWFARVRGGSVAGSGGAEVDLRRPAEQPWDDCKERWR